MHAHTAADTGVPQLPSIGAGKPTETVLVHPGPTQDKIYSKSSTLWQKLSTEALLLLIHVNYLINKALSFTKQPISFVFTVILKINTCKIFRIRHALVAAALVTADSHTDIRTLVLSGKHFTPHY